MMGPDLDLVLAAARSYAVAGEREQAMVVASGRSVVRAWQRVNALLEDPAAWEAAPAAMLVLRRRRERGRRLTSGG